MNRNLFISVATVLLYVGIQCTLNVADARVCFAVGNQKCSDGSYPNNRSVESKNCESLGYTLSCGANQEFDPNAGTCVNNGKIYHQCRCNRETYPYTISDETDKYKVAGAGADVCKDKDGTEHYKYRVCREKYNAIVRSFSSYMYSGIIKEISTSQGTCSLYDVYNEYQSLPISNVCSANATLGEECIEDITATGNCAFLSDTLSHKYAGCTCDGFYAPTQYPDVFSLSGEECTASSSHDTYRKNKTCKNVVTAGGTWKSECSDDEKSSSVDDVTEEGVTCHLCKKMTCEDYSLYTEAEQCENGIDSDSKCTEQSPEGNSSLACYGRQPKTCSDYAYEEGHYYNEGHYVGSTYYSGYYSDASFDYDPYYYGANERYYFRLLDSAKACSQMLSTDPNKASHTCELVHYGARNQVSCYRLRPLACEELSTSTETYYTDASACENAITGLEGFKCILRTQGNLTCSVKTMRTCEDYELTDGDCSSNQTKTTQNVMLGTEEYACTKCTDNTSSGGSSGGYYGSGYYGSGYYGGSSSSCPEGKVRFQISNGGTTNPITGALIIDGNGNQFDVYSGDHNANQSFTISARCINAGSGCDFSANGRYCYNTGMGCTFNDLCGTVVISR